MRRAGSIGMLAVLACVITLCGQAAGASAGEVEDFQGSWTQRALADQYELGNVLGLRNAPFVGTHNSFNSEAEMGPALSAQDSNQVLDLRDQLDVGIRSLELDIHRVPAAPGGVPKVCHALDMAVGCTIEKDLGPVLEEIAGWLATPVARDQVLLLYLEDALDTEPAYEDAAASVEAILGRWLYHPRGEGCSELPLELTRKQILASGANLIIVSDCGLGDGWPTIAHSWDSHREERPFGFEAFPACGPDFERSDYRSRLIRYYEDSTQLTATAGNPDDGITPATAARMASCGVDLIGLDQLRPRDGRLARLVWSWAEGEPSQGGCALIRIGQRYRSGRWVARGCRRFRRPVACRSAGRWSVLRRVKVSGRRANRVCRRRSMRFAAPRTGFENQRLRRAMGRTKTKTAWLAYHRGSDGFESSRRPSRRSGVPRR